MYKSRLLLSLLSLLFCKRIRPPKSCLQMFTNSINRQFIPIIKYIYKVDI